MPRANVRYGVIFAAYPQLALACPSIPHSSLPRAIPLVLQSQAVTRSLSSPDNSAKPLTTETVGVCRHSMVLAAT